MLDQSESQPYLQAINSTCTLELIDPFHCLISNFSKFPLPSVIVQTHELVPCIKRKGYSAKLKMLNSLKRCFEELGITMIELPNIAFKVFKPINICGNSQRNKKSSFEKASPDKLIKKQSINFKKISSYNKQLVSVGRWILTPHQKRAVLFFQTHGKRMILSHGYNKGKKVTSLACSQHCRSNINNRVLIVVPKSELVSWAWHLKQLKISLTIKNKKNNKITFEVLDWQSKQLPDFIGSVKIVKQQIGAQKAIQIKSQSKMQAKLKKQSISIYPKSYSSHILVSYEFLSQNSRLEPQQFSFLILSHPQITTISGQYTNNYENALSMSYSKHLASIESIVIIKQVTLNQTRRLLPILNTRLDWAQIQERYGNFNQNVHHQMQYQSAIKNYVFFEDDQFIRSPSNSIKSILIAKPFNKTNQHNKIDRQLGLFQNLQSDDELIKVELTIEKIKNKFFSRYDFCFVVLQSNKLKFTVIQKLQSIKLQPILISSNVQIVNSVISKINKREKIICLGSLAQIANLFQYYHNTNSHSHSHSKLINLKSLTMTILCSTYTRQQSDIISINLCKIYRYSNMSYIQLCEIKHEKSNNSNSTQISVHRVQQMNEQIIIPSIDNRIFMTCFNADIQQISSEESAQQKRKLINPQRYHQSDQNDSSPEQPIQNNRKMVDEKQETIINNQMGRLIFDNHNNIDEVSNQNKYIPVNPISIESEDEVFVVNSCSQSWHVKEKNDIFVQNDQQMQPQVQNYLSMQNTLTVTEHPIVNIISLGVNPKKNKIVKNNKRLINQKNNRNLRSKKRQESLNDTNKTQQIQIKSPKRDNSKQSKISSKDKDKSMSSIRNSSFIDSQIYKRQIKSLKQRLRPQNQEKMPTRITRSNKKDSPIVKNPSKVEKLRIQSNQIYKSLKNPNDEMHQKFNKQVLIDIQSDSSNYQPIQKIAHVSTKIPKVTSKQVLFLKLIPNISQMVDNNSDTIC